MGIFLPFGGCAVLWLCSLVFGFGPSTKSSVWRHKAENWCGVSLRSRGECRIAKWEKLFRITNFVVALGGQDGGFLSEYLERGLSPMALS